MALLLDGTPASGTFSTTNTKVLNLTTTVADTVIVVIVANEKNTGSFTTSSISDDHSLTWHLRKQLQWNVTSGNTTHQNVDVYWAHAASAATYAITATLNQNTDDSCMVCFAVSGADTTTPFDPNGSLPASASDVSGTNTSRAVSGVSTSIADTFMFSLMANAQNQTATSPTGFTNIASPANSGGSLFQYLAVDYKIQTGTQSAITVTEGGSSGQNWGMVVDAIQILNTDLDVTAAPSLGFNLAATVTPELDLTASFSLGVSQAVTVDNGNINITAASALGFSMSATLSMEENEPVSYALGFGLAAVLTRELDTSAAFSAGFSMRVVFGTHKHQPVVNVLS